MPPSGDRPASDPTPLGQSPSGDAASGESPSDAHRNVPFSQLLRERVTRSAALESIPYVRSRADKVGQAPGEVTFVGEAPAEPPRLSVIDYDAQALTASQPEDARALHPLRDRPTTTWINLDGLHDTDLIEKIGDHFGLHPLVLEDVAHTNQRPKVETYAGEEDGASYLFVVLKMLTYDDEHQTLQSEQISLALGAGWLISFQERPGDVFDPVRQRLRKAGGRLRRRGADYLAYALLDVIVDHYFLVLEAFGTRTEEIEEEIVEGDPSPRTQQHLNGLRRDLILTRRAVWPTRDLFATLERGSREDAVEERLISEEVRPFLRDTYDHAVQVLDILESLRDVVGGLGELYMSSLSHRMNEVMQVLTIIGTIFIPLTFIAGIYGMNFEYMPELGWRYSYFVAMGAMGLVSAALLVYFRRKGWL
jgi:magnesium transporter